MMTMGFNQYRQRQSNLYQPGSKVPFSISRSKIDMFKDCPRCFYMDRRLGLPKPSIPGFSLNNAVDNLFKNEFDLLRKKGESHELMKQYKIDAIPFEHPKLSEWRDDYYRYVGASVIHPKTNLKITGIIDDIWQNPQEELLIVDYKSTSTTKEISLEDKWKKGYKHQIELYQWIFRQLGFKVSPTGYIVYANGRRNNPRFDAKLEFDLTIHPFEGDDSWVEPVLKKIKKCLDSDKLPDPGVNEEGHMCEHCAYKKASAEKVAEMKRV